jgi:hypothetical protein
VLIPNGSCHSCQSHDPQRSTIDDQRTNKKLSKTIQ